MIYPAGQATQPADNKDAWKVIGLVFAGLLAFEAIKYAARTR